MNADKEYKTLEMHFTCSNTRGSKRIGLSRFDYDRACFRDTFKMQESERKKIVYFVYLTNVYTDTS